MTSRRRLRSWTALLLPLLLLRVMLPAGYMAVATGGELHIVMCSAGLVMHSDGGATGQDRPQPSDTGNCLFAHAASFAPPIAGACCQLAPLSASSNIPVLAQHSPSTGPPRFAAARGPPSCS